MGQELWVRTKSGLDGRVCAVLEFDLPVVRHQPTSDEVVIVSIERAELTEEEHLVGETIHECRLLDDTSTNDGRSAGDDEDSPVDCVGGCQLEVMSLEVDATKEVKEGAEAQTSRLSSHLLAGTDAADLSIFEGSHNCGEEVGTGPEHMVVGKHRKFGLHVWDCCTYLSTLTSDFCSEDGQFGGRIGQLKVLDHRLTGALIGFSNCNDDDRGRRVNQDRVKALVEVFIERVNSRHNDSAVSARVAWLGRNRRRLVSEEVGDDMHKQSQVSGAEEEPKVEVRALSDRIYGVEKGQYGRRNESKC